MNCREGDVARVISPGRLTACPFCGTRATAVKPDTFVRVTQHDGIAWILEEPVVGAITFDCGQALAFRCISLVDEILRPIRGDDVSDDEVRELYAPSTSEVSHG
jgi:hypothetical protein